MQRSWLGQWKCDHTRVLSSPTILSLGLLHSHSFPHLGVPLLYFCTKKGDDEGVVRE